jgi:hypothetical protein
MSRMFYLSAVLAALLVDPTAARAQPSAPWLAGCWSLRNGSKLVEENWTNSQAGVMLGLSRTINNGKMTEYEFVVLRPKGDRLEYGVRLADKPEVVFTSTTLSAKEVIFENPEHPFPKRIGYTISRPDSLDAWIDGSAGSNGPRVAYAYHRVPCTNP